LVYFLLYRMLVYYGLLGVILLATLRGTLRESKLPAVLFWLANGAMVLWMVDAFLVEPLMVEMTELTLAFEELDPAERPVRIVHLTDTHIERIGVREERVIEEVNEQDPDLIVLTGDYLNTSYLSDPTAAEHWRRMIGQLEAPYGIYATRGSVEPSPASMVQLLEGTRVVWLEQEAVQVPVRGETVTLVGVACSHNMTIDSARLAEALRGVSESDLTVLLYHSPDLIPEAAEHGVDLVLGGHTHGGQIRLPFYGAVIAASAFGTKYAAGLYQEGGTQMVISRGLGFEGGIFPRARFLCRPEIVSIDLVGI
jgi:predicted MPP superfamily phosphohydrolase